jgi:hypothetical protein
MRLVGNTEKWLMKVKMLDPRRLARSQQKMFFFWSNGRCNKLQTCECTTSAGFICFFLNPCISEFTNL